MFKVAWKDDSLHGRGPSAVIEARSRLGEVTHPSLPVAPLTAHGRLLLVFIVLTRRAHLASQVSGYNPMPRFERPRDGLNCESFVRQCLDGHARSAQAESLSGDPEGGCTVM